ncbi:hypothetical protein VNO77_44264 [Canavalia gladiata]|uniref:Uncharacterized protein n=1 Tax=Canavalia gladiata TaxID=3824 RepID=A0AAN9PQU8_CANGL
MEFFKGSPVIYCGKDLLGICGIPQGQGCPFRGWDLLGILEMDQGIFSNYIGKDLLGILEMDWGSVVISYNKDLLGIMQFDRGSVGSRLSHPFFENGLRGIRTSCRGPTDSAPSATGPSL